VQPTNNPYTIAFNLRISLINLCFSVLLNSIVTVTGAALVSAVVAYVAYSVLSKKSRPRALVQGGDKIPFVLIDKKVCDGVYSVLVSSSQLSLAVLRILSFIS
jgi:hypothetical protein